MLIKWSKIKDEKSANNKEFSGAIFASLLNNFGAILKFRLFTKEF